MLMATARVEGVAVETSSEWWLKVFISANTACVLTSSFENAMNQARTLPAPSPISRNLGYAGYSLQLVFDALGGLSGHAGHAVGGVFCGA
jgi:hypothetical protein